MKRKKKNNLYLGSISKAQRRLIKSEQEVGKLRRLYTKEAVEHEKAVRSFQIEVRRASYFADCVEFLHLALTKAKNQSKEEIDNELAKYVDFESIKYNEFLREKKKLSIIEYSAYGKECTTNLEIH